MKLGSKYLFSLLAIGLMASEANAADVTIIHGINGLDLGAAKDLPVDIAVNGTCSLKGVKFTQSTTVTLEQGSYRVTVHPADGKCSNAAVIDKTLTINERNYSLTTVASLSSAGAPQLAVFDNSDYAWGRAVAVRHVAYAPPVYSRIRVKGYKSTVKKIRNGDFGDAFIGWVLDIPYNISILSRPRGGELVNLKGVYKGNWRIFHIVGSAKNGLAIVKQDI